MLAIANERNGVILRAANSEQDANSGRVVKAITSIELPPGALGPLGLPGSFYRLLWSPNGKWLLMPSLALLNMSALPV